MRTIDKIVIHYTATADSWYADRPIADKVTEIDRWHKARGWSGFGYHYLIDKDGAIAEGRPLEKIGAHARGHNARSIGICYVGNSRPTPEQFTALAKLITDLQARFSLPNDAIMGHRDVGSTDCPGFDVGEWWSRRRTHAGTVT